MDVKWNDGTIRLSARTCLDGDHLVVFLHGFGCAKESFDQAFSTTELSGLSLCAFDFPGHGMSARSAAAGYTLQAYADVTNAVIDRIPHKMVSMVCHSMGGAVGLIATQERRDMGVFISVDGNLVAQDCGIVSRSTAAQSREEFSQQGYRQYLSQLRSSAEPDSNAWARWYAAADPIALYESACSLVEWSDNGKLLGLFKSLHGQAYIYGEREDKDYLLPDLRGLACHMVPDAGHFVMLDNSEDFYEFIGRLLRRDGVREESHTETLRLTGN
jgi:pimeloyl-ACP methyl ester carboxylesterase